MMLLMEFCDTRILIRSNWRLTAGKVRLRLVL